MKEVEYSVWYQIVYFYYTREEAVTLITTNWGGYTDLHAHTTIEEVSGKTNLRVIGKKIWRWKLSKYMKKAKTKRAVADRL